MSIGTTLVTSFLITLVRPASWALALASFLLRGGIVIVVAPVVVIPSTVGFANLIAPLVTSAVFGGGIAALAAILVALGAIGLFWLLVGGLASAAAEGEVIRLVAEDVEVVERLPEMPRSDGARAGSILAVRLLAGLPLLLVLVWGAGRLVEITYRELTLPSDVTVPILARVVGAGPEVVLIVIAAWLSGGAVGSLSARRIVIADEPVAGALRWAVVRLIRHPLRTLTLEVVPLLALATVLVPSVAAASAAWSAIRASFEWGGTFSGTLGTLGAVVAFVGLWLGGLVLVAVISAWRAAAWTLDVGGTFGPVRSGRPGGWRPTNESATLSDLRPGGVDPDTR